MVNAIILTLKACEVGSSCPTWMEKGNDTNGMIAIGQCCSTGIPTCLNLTRNHEKLPPTDTFIPLARVCTRLASFNNVSKMKDANM